MKNWCKIFEFENYDVLLRKDSSEQQEVIILAIYDDEEGVTGKMIFTYADRTTRDNKFDSFDKETIGKMSIGLKIKLQELNY